MNRILQIQKADSGQWMYKYTTHGINQIEWQYGPWSYAAAIQQAIDRFGEFDQVQNLDEDLPDYTHAKQIGWAVTFEDSQPEEGLIIYRLPLKDAISYLEETGYQVEKVQVIEQWYDHDERTFGPPTPGRSGK